MRVDRKSTVIWVPLGSELLQPRLKAAYDRGFQLGLAGGVLLAAAVAGVVMLVARLLGAA